MTYTIEEQIAEVKRELAHRRNVYPEFVASKRITQEAADRRIAVMEGMLQTLTASKGMLLSLCWLVGLKDERPADYEEQKPLAWGAARLSIKEANKAFGIGSVHQPLNTKI